jgi:hypothetical protein
MPSARIPTVGREGGGVKYEVTLPVAGIVYAEVEASSEKEAIKIAMERQYTNDDIDEWEVYDRLFEGNVTHVTEYEAHAEEI